VDSDEARGVPPAAGRQGRDQLMSVPAPAPEAAASDAGLAIGAGLRRYEDARLVTGSGHFIDDLTFPDMLFMSVVRSPVARGVLRSVDGASALAMDGVVAVLTASDLPLPERTLRFIHPASAEIAEAGHPVLALNAVRYVGEPVAAVLAETRAAAADGAAAVVLEIDAQRPVMDFEHAADPGLTVHDLVPDNVLMRWRVSGGDPEQAFRSATHVVRQRVVMPRLVAAPMEVRGSIASYDQASGALTVWISSQDQHRPRAQLSEYLDLPLDRVRVIVPDVGGAFGSKGPVPSETVAAAVLSMRTGRPVKWVEDRQSNFLGAYQGRGMISEAELALDGQGRMLGIRARLRADFGAYMVLNTATISLTTSGLLAGPYSVPAASVEVLGMATNKVPTGPYRGAGRPEAGVIMEGLVDLAARELRLDPAELRRRNLIPPGAFPYLTPVGMTYDSGDYEPVLDRALELSEYGRWRERQRDWNPDQSLGIGISATVERSGTGLWEAATVRITADGRVVVQSGSTSSGQGHETTFAQIASDALSLPLEAIRIEEGDSGFGAMGVGTFGSRATTVGGSAVWEAARAVKVKLDRIAAHALSADRVVWADGRVSAVGGDARSLTLEELAEIAHSPESLPEDQEPGLEATCRFTLPGFVVSLGVYVAVVAIDRSTGHIDVLSVTAVDDAGRIINPLLAEGQVVGGAVQGLGQALLEEVIHDADGQPTTTSFLDYLIPSALEVPEFSTALLETPSPFSPLGTKGIGEAGAIGAPAALAGAIYDALGGRGSDTVVFPFTLERLWNLSRS